MINEANILKTLDKGLVVVLYLAQIDRSISVTELSKSISINKSTVFKILKTLQKRGFVLQFENEKYGLRTEIFQMIVDQSCFNPSLQRVARFEIEKLSEYCEETITLSSLVGSKVQCVDKIDSSVTVHVTHKIGRYSPLYAAATGKAILAFYSDDSLREYIEETPLKSYTNQTITSVEELTSDLKSIRDRGFAISNGELDLGVSGVAAPIFQANNMVIGAVSIWGLTQGMPNTKLSEYGSFVKSTGLRISEKLGYATK